MNKKRPRMVIIVSKPSFGLLQLEKFYNISALLHSHSHVIKLKLIQFNYLVHDYDPVTEPKYCQIFFSL